MIDSNSIKNKICKLFATATGNTTEKSFEILFENTNFDQFDEILGFGSLELIKKQIIFFESTLERAKEESDESQQKMMNNLAMQLLSEAMNEIISFVFGSFGKKQIDEQTLEERCEEIKTIFPKNQKLQDKIDKTIGKVLNKIDVK